MQPFVLSFRSKGTWLMRSPPPSVKTKSLPATPLDAKAKVAGSGLRRFIVELNAEINFVVLRLNWCQRSCIRY